MRVSTPKPVFVLAHLSNFLSPWLLLSPSASLSSLPICMDVIPTSSLARERSSTLSSLSGRDHFHFLPFAGREPFHIVPFLWEVVFARIQWRKNVQHTHRPVFLLNGLYVVWRSNRVRLDEIWRWGLIFNVTTSSDQVSTFRLRREVPSYAFEHCREFAVNFLWRSICCLYYCMYFRSNQWKCISLLSMYPECLSLMKLKFAKKKEKIGLYFHQLSKTIKIVFSKVGTNLEVLVIFFIMFHHDLVIINLWHLKYCGNTLI